MKNTKLLLRFFGAIVCALLLLEAVLIFCSPEFEDFFGFCHWFGNGLLGVLVGGAGCYLEVKGSMSTVANQFQRFALNRIMLSVYYFWLGCWVMGGMPVLYTKEGFKTLAHITGFISWAVALGDLLVSCTAECRARDQDVTKTDAGKTTSQEDGPDIPSAKKDLECGTHGVATFPTGMPPTPASAGAAIPEAAPASGVEADEDPAGTGPFEEPAGGWNGAVTSKPFGCS